MRPRSIILFERIYLAYVLVGVASGVWTLLNWSSVMPAGMPQPMLSMMPVFMAGGVLITLAIDLLLWFFIARRGSDVAKWIFVVLFALAAAGVLRSLFGHSQIVLPAIVKLVSTVRFILDAVCTVLLFRPDAARWFKGERAPGDLHDTFS